MRLKKIFVTMNFDKHKIKFKRPRGIPLIYAHHDQFY
jgi:hypothetical protein